MSFSVGKASIDDVPHFQFENAKVSARLGDGPEQEFEFEYRDPRKWIEQLIADPTLAHASHFHSSKKYYCEGNFTERLWDEPWTGDVWVAIDVSRFSNFGFPN